MYHDAMSRPAAQCPYPAGRDDRKSAHLAAEHLKPAPGARVASGFLFAREILRSGAMRQAAVGLGADRSPRDDPEKGPVFFLDGEPHRRKRAEIARFFTPTAIATRYRAVMERAADTLLAGVRTEGRGQLDRISFELAV